MSGRGTAIRLYIVVTASLLLGTAQARSNPIQDRVVFELGDEGFEEVFPVTENLNTILAELSRIEAEQGRGIPNFIVYPYEAEDPEALPYALVWHAGAYTKVTRLSASEEAFVIYDPRRLAVRDLEMEGGERVEYRHLVLRCGFNRSLGEGAASAVPVSRLEPTASSVYISRAIVAAGNEGEGGPARVRTTHQTIAFPRISVPKEIDGHKVEKISLRFESLLEVEASTGGADEAGPFDASSFPVN